MTSLAWMDGLAASSLATFGEASLRIAVVLGAAWMLCLVLRRRSAALRHTIWVVSLAAVAAMPMLMNLAPRWRVQAPWPASASRTTLNQEVDAPLPAAAWTSPKGPHPSSAVALDTERASVPFVGDVPLDNAARSTVPGVSSKPAYRLPSPAVCLIGIWVLGFSVFLSRVVIGHLRLRNLARGAAEAGEIEDLAGCLDVDREVRFLQSAAETMPMTWGWRKPAVVLPASFSKWDRERRAMTVCHELAHVRRADWLTQTLAQVAGAFYWFHPLVWLALRRLRIEADCACDDLVLAAGVRPSGYAGHLVQVAREFRSAGLRPWVAIAMAHPSSLDRRVQYVLDENVSRGRLGRFGKLAAVLGVAAIVLMVPSVEAVGRSESAPRLGIEPSQKPFDDSIAEPVANTAEPQLDAARSGVGLLAQAQAPALAQQSQDSQQSQAAQQSEDAGRPVKVPSPERLEERARKKAERDAKERSGEFKNELLRKAVSQKRPRLSPQAMQTAGAALRQALTSPDAKVRAEAAEALGNLGSAEEANLQALGKAVSDSEPAVQKNAVESLGRLLRSDKDLPGDRAVGYLAPALSSPNAGLRREAAEALGKLRGPAAISMATKLIDTDANPQVQREAVESLGRMLRRSDAQEAKSALPALAKALGAKDPNLRRQVAETLGGLHVIADDVVPLLAKAAQDPDPGVQRQAVESLGQISSPDDFDWELEIEDAIEGEIGGVIEGTIGGVIEGKVKQAVPDAYKLLRKADELRQANGEI